MARQTRSSVTHWPEGRVGRGPLEPPPHWGLASSSAFHSLPLGVIFKEAQEPHVDMETYLNLAALLLQLLKLALCLCGLLLGNHHSSFQLVLQQAPIQRANNKRRLGLVVKFTSYPTVHMGTGHLSHATHSGLPDVGQSPREPGQGLLLHGAGWYTRDAEFGLKTRLLVHSCFLQVEWPEQRSPLLLWSITPSPTPGNK